MRAVPRNGAFPAPRGLEAADRGAFRAAVIYILADSFILPRGRAFESASHRKILRENTRFAPRAALAAALKTGRFMPDRRPFGAHFDAFR